MIMKIIKPSSNLKFQIKLFKGILAILKNGRGPPPSVQGRAWPWRPDPNGVFFVMCSLKLWLSFSFGPGQGQRFQLPPSGRNLGVSTGLVGPNRKWSDSRWSASGLIDDQGNHNTLLPPSCGVQPRTASIWKPGLWVYNLSFPDDLFINFTPFLQSKSIFPILFLSLFSSQHQHSIQITTTRLSSILLFFDLTSWWGRVKEDTEGTASGWDSTDSSSKTEDLARERATVDTSVVKRKAIWWVDEETNRKRMNIDPTYRQECPTHDEDRQTTKRER